MCWICCSAGQTRCLPSATSVKNPWTNWSKNCAIRAICPMALKRPNLVVTTSEDAIMRHRVSGKKLGRNGSQRNGLRLALATALLEHGRIQTTQTKADFIRADVEKLITLAKRSKAHSDPQRVVHAQRLAASRLNNNRELVQK